MEADAGPDQAEVLAFEAATFPSWLWAFQRAESQVLVARDPARAIVGTLLFRGPADATLSTPLLGRDAGTIGCVGVAAAIGRQPLPGPRLTAAARRCITDSINL